MLYVTFRHVLPAAASQPASCDTQAQAWERKGNLSHHNVTWNDEQPQRAGFRVKIISGSIQRIIGQVGLVLKAGHLTQGKWKNAAVYLIQLEDTSDGKEVNVITLQKFTSELDGTQPGLASPAAGAPVVVPAKRPTRRSQETTASSIAAALEQGPLPAAPVQPGARCG